MAKINSRI